MESAFSIYFVYNAYSCPCGDLPVILMALLGSLLPVPCYAKEIINLHFLSHAALWAEVTPYLELLSTVGKWQLHSWNLTQAHIFIKEIVTRLTSQSILISYGVISWRGI